MLRSRGKVDVRDFSKEVDPENKWEPKAMNPPSSVLRCIAIRAFDMSQGNAIIISDKLISTEDCLNEIRQLQILIDRARVLHTVGQGEERNYR